MMVLAGFYKHNLFAIPVTAICWLALRDIRRALSALLFGIAACVLGLAVCWFVYGPQFFDELLSPRVYRVTTALGGIGRLQWIAPAFVFVAIWAWHQRHSDAGRLVGVFTTAAFTSYFLQKLVEGVADNAQFELTVALAIGIGCAIHDIAAIPAVQRWGIERGRTLIVFVLIIRLLLSLRVSPYLLLASSDFRQSLYNDALIATAESTRVAAIPGNVSCSIVTVCRAAGKPFKFDSFNVPQRVATGRLTQTEVDRLIRAQGIQFVQIDARASWRNRH
jgi:hypothetical protein